MRIKSHSILTALVTFLLTVTEFLAKKQLKEGWVYFGSGSECKGTVSHVGKGQWEQEAAVLGKQ